MTRSIVEPKDNIVLRLPSGQHKQLQINPHTVISIGKYGTFLANSLLGRPYNLTYELLEPVAGEKSSKLRVVPASELHAEALADKHGTPAETREDDEGGQKEDGTTQFEIIDDNGKVLMRNNRLTVDDPSRQALTMEEIEELKKASAGSGREIIEKIMASHSAIGEKTSFSLAKYTLRKSNKYMKRFTVLPMNVELVASLLLEKESPRIMEMRMESLGLLTSWANVHHGVEHGVDEEEEGQVGGGRWLVVDDTAGLVTAAMAEKMGLLHEVPELTEEGPVDSAPTGQTKHCGVISDTNGDAMDIDTPAMTSDVKSNVDQLPSDTTQSASVPQTTRRPPRRQNHKYGTPASAANTNTITTIHSNSEPNISLLSYFNINPLELPHSHPLYSHLKTLTWLQLLDLESDTTYQEPKAQTEQQLKAMKSSKRTQYHKRRWRWQRVRDTVAETQKGGFDGLVVASTMKPQSVLKHLVPLVRGGGQIAVYSPTIEPLTTLMDFYSRERRGAYVRLVQSRQSNGSGANAIDGEDFPLDPTLVINPMLQTSRARQWQVLPGRTHPMMTSRGGPEGYVFTATRVIPLEGRVEARGKFTKKRKVEDDKSASGNATPSTDKLPPSEDSTTKSEDAAIRAEPSSEV